MSGDVIREFLISLGFQVDDPQAIERFAGKAGVAIAGVVAGVAAAAAGMFAFTSQVADEFDALGDLANRVNSTASELQEFGYVATMTGSSVEAANASIERLSSVAGDAAMGMGKGAKVFESLGINVKDANGQLKNSTDLMWEVGDAIKDMERGQQVAVLKRLGLDPTLVDTLTTSVGGLRDEFQSVYAAVGLDANNAAEASGEFMDSMDRLKFVLGAVGKSLAVNFMSRFTDGMNRLRKLIVDNLPRIMSVLRPIIDLVLTAADVFIALAYRAGQAVGVIIGWLSKVNEATDGWAGYILAAAAAWKYLNLAFLATPIGLIISLVAAIGLLIDDFMTWREGGDSLIPWDSWSAEIAMVEAGLGHLQSFLEGWFTMLFAMVDALVSVFKGDFQGAWIAIGIAIETVAAGIETVFGSALEYVKSQFTSAFDWINNVFTLIQASVSVVAEAISGAFDGALEYVKSQFTSAFDWINNVFTLIQASVSVVAEAISRAFDGALDAIKAKFTEVFEWIGGVIDSILEKFDQVTGAVGDFVSGVGADIGGAFSSAGEFLGIGGPALTPSVAAAGGSQSVNQQTQIVVQGSSDPGATARAVAGAQSTVNADMARNLKGAAR